YIEVPSEHFSCVDALAQRQAGFERSTGDVVVFQHDDHMFLPPDYYELSIGMSPGWGTPAYKQIDVLVPARYTRLRDVNGERLYNGEDRFPFSGSPDVPYISGHCAIYRREVLEACPWGNVEEQFTWDIRHTEQIRDAGFKIEWSDALRAWDVEAGAAPW
ncbi:hypothetical protein LCGC14_2722840, partial [marine sediment metagenome]